MNRETKYLEFGMIEQKPKTQVWEIRSKRYGDRLGIIKWYGSWRQYTFFPESETVWNHACLADLINFLKELMNKRKEALKK